MPNPYKSFPVENGDPPVTRTTSPRHLRTRIASAYRSSDNKVDVTITPKSPPPDAIKIPATDAEDMFAEMIPFMVDVQNFDDTRESLYTRMEGE